MLLALVRGAVAGVPFELPPDETPSDWSAALALAGFSASPWSAGEGIEIVVVSGSWRVVAHDGAGSTRTVEIAHPRTMQDRQDVAWMAQSLLDPVIAPEPIDVARPMAPVAKSPARRRPKTTPATTPTGTSPEPTTSSAASGPTTDPAANPAVAVSAAAVTIVDPAPAAERINAPPVAPPPGPTTANAAPAPAPDRRSSARLTLAAGGGARLREGVAAAPLAVVDVGLRLDAWTAGMTVEGIGAGELMTVPAAAAAASRGVAAMLAVGWRPAWRLAPEVTLGGGTAHYQFGSAGTFAEGEWVPIVAGTGAACFRIAPAVSVSAGARLVLDGDVLHLRIDGRETGTWSAWSVEPTLRLVVEPGAARRGVDQNAGAATSTR